ncbi:hypothetical protein [Kitasatospora sp. NPDC127116]
MRLVPRRRDAAAPGVVGLAPASCTAADQVGFGSVVGRKLVSYEHVCA